MKMKITLFFSTGILQFCVLILLLLPSHSIDAQTSAIIGNGALNGTSSNGTTGDPGPMYRSNATSLFTFSRYNYLYTAAELAAAGITNGSSITKIGWFKDNNAAGNSPCVFEAWIKNSALTVIGSGGQSWATLISAATPVYSNSAHVVDTVIGWHEITFTSPFIYTGGALEISCNFDISQGSSPWSTAGFSWKKDLVSNVTLSYCGNAAPGPTQPNLRTVRPQLKITYSPFVGIAEKGNASPLFLNAFPNPARDQVCLTAFSLQQSPSILRLYTLTSELVLEQILTQQDVASPYFLDTENYPRGMYLLQFISDAGMETQKLILE